MTPEVTQAHCNRCGCSTMHDVIAAERQKSADNETGDVSYDLYEMLKCRGCESVSLRHTWRSSRHSKPEITQYPPTIARRTPDWTAISLTELGLSDDDAPAVPTDVKMLMREVYSAAQNGLSKLAAMGIRAALEAVMIDKVDDEGNFRKNTDAFQAAGYLSVRQRGHLDAILEAGHAAIHRGWTPNDQDIHTLLDIAESVIETAYMHDQPTDALERKVPRKPSKSARKSH